MFWRGRVLWGAAQCCIATTWKKLRRCRPTAQNAPKKPADPGGQPPTPYSNLTRVPTDQVFTFCLQLTIRVFLEIKRLEITEELSTKEDCASCTSVFDDFKVWLTNSSVHCRDEDYGGDEHWGRWFWRRRRFNDWGAACEELYGCR